MGTSITFYWQGFKFPVTYIVLHCIALYRIALYCKHRKSISIKTDCLVSDHVMLVLKTDQCHFNSITASIQYCSQPIRLLS